MPIVRNDTDSFPAAEAVAVGPYTALDCCAYQTMEALYNAMQAAGHACVFRGGQLFVERTVAQLVTACAVAAPTVTAPNPDPIDETAPWLCQGTGFQTSVGKVYLADTNNWGTATKKIEQNAGNWFATYVSMGTPIMDGLPYHPSHVYIFVETVCGQRNAVGFETEVAAAPP